MFEEQSLVVDVDVRDWQVNGELKQEQCRDFTAHQITAVQSELIFDFLQTNLWNI